MQQRDQPGTPQSHTLTDVKNRGRFLSAARVLGMAGALGAGFLAGFGCEGSGDTDVSGNSRTRGPRGPDGVSSQRWLGGEGRTSPRVRARRSSQDDDLSHSAGQPRQCAHAVHRKRGGSRAPAKPRRLPGRLPAGTALSAAPAARRQQRKRWQWRRRPGDAAFDWCGGQRRSGRLGWSQRRGRRDHHRLATSSQPPPAARAARFRAWA